MISQYHVHGYLSSQTWVIEKENLWQRPTRNNSTDSKNGKNDYYVLRECNMVSTLFQDVCVSKCIYILGIYYAVLWLVPFWTSIILCVKRPHVKTQVHFLSRVMVTVQYFPRKSTRHEYVRDDKWFHKDFISPKHTFDARVCKYFILIYIEKCRL